MPKRIARALPVLGVLAFLLLYFWAASLYSSADIRPGYNHLHNYWCELYNPLTHTGHLNPGRPLALLAIPILTTTLFFFWFSITALFPEFPLLGWFVRLTGAISMTAASFVFTPAHDLILTLAVPLGVAAILATCIGLARKHEWPLLILALLAITIASADYLFWKIKIMGVYQPIIQKSAFALVLLWFLTAALKVLRLSAQPQSSELKHDDTADKAAASCVSLSAKQYPADIML